MGEKGRGGGYRSMEGSGEGGEVRERGGEVEERDGEEGE